MTVDGDTLGNDKEVKNDGETGGDHEVDEDEFEGDQEFRVPSRGQTRRRGQSISPGGQRAAYMKRRYYWCSERLRWVASNCQR